MEKLKEIYSSKKKDDFSIRLLIKQYLKYRYVYIFGSIAIIIAGISFYKFKTPLYKIQSTLLVKDKERGEYTNPLSNEFDIELENKNVENEAEIIKSKDLVNTVVKELSLHHIYSEKGFIKNKLIDESNIAASIIIVKNEEVLYDKELEFILLSKNEFTYKNKVYQYGDIIKNEENVLFKLDKRNIDTEYPYTFRVKINNPTIISEEIRETITTLIPSKNSTYIEVSLLYPLPKKGVFILNKLIEDFQQNNIKEAKRINDSIIKLIDKRLDLINEQLSELGVNQQKFKESRKITFLNDDAQSILEEMRNTDNEIIGMQVRLENINRIDKSLSDNATLLSPPNVDLNDPVLTSLINDYNQRNNEKEKIIYRSGSEHPNVISISENLYKIKISIIDNIRIQRERIQRNLQLLKRKRDELNTDISNIPYSEKNLIEILREKNIREKIYTYLLERREEASIYDLSEITKTRIIDRAYSSIKPISPSKKIIAAIILFAIIIIPTAIIYFYQKFNPRILNETFDKLNSYTIIGGLNRIKQFNYDQIKNKGIIGLRDEFQQISQYLARNKKKIIMVAGLSGNEGVRFSVLNIIMCLSAWNKRTILLDLCVGDSKVLRDISVRERLSIKKNLKIKVKSEHSSLFSFSEIKDFDIGEINEHENLSSYQNYQELINELSQQYEYMIIHAPSVIKNILAQRIDTLTDINIIVVRENVTRVDHFQELQNITSMQNLKEPLIIINDK